MNKCQLEDIPFICIGKVCNTWNFSLPVFAKIFPKNLGKTILEGTIN